MSDANPDSTISRPAEPVCVAIATICPLMLLAAYTFLLTSRGSRMFDAFASRNYGTGIVAMGVLFIGGAGLLLLGAAMSVGAVVRRERPAWLARLLLGIHALAVLAALRMMF